MTVNWTKGNCEQKIEPDLDQDKRAQEKLSTVEIIFGDIIDLLVEQTNLYAKRDRNKTSSD